MSEPWTRFSIAGRPMPSSALMGLDHRLNPIAQARRGRRNINGKYRPRTRTNWRLYEYVVAGSGVAPLAIGGLWPDQIVDVVCGCEIGQPAGTAIERDVFPGSLRFENAAERPVATEGEAAWKYYIPSMTLVVMSFETADNQDGAEATWTITFEEVEAPDA